MALALRIAATIVGVSLAAGAATPPTTVNYQGVLRNASDKPLAGTYDMQFAFYDAAGGGTQIMTDQHAAATFNAVTVAGGLFNVQLGGGTVADGTGAGAYTSLADVFRDYGAVYLEIKVGAETLTPRVKLQSAAYALNATNLNGRAGSGYVDTSATTQTKAGPFIASASGASQYGVQGYGTNGGGYFAEQNGNSGMYAGYSGYAAYGIGNVGGAYFSDTGGASAYLAHSGNGVEGYASARGGWFKTTANATEAMLATNGGYGVYANGTYMGGLFSDDVGGGSDRAYLANGGYGVKGTGSNAGGYFLDAEDGAKAYIGSNGWGVYGIQNTGGSGAGGFFTNGSGNAYAVLGTDTTSSYGGAFGIKAVADSLYGWPGDFVESRLGTFARVAYGGTKVYGNGIVDFVQNHPADAAKLIVYAAPEGDEAAVYTRGSARLTHGEARITLGETFQWVANPDLGLTVQVTPRGSWSQLYVVAVSPTELVVRSRSGAGDAEFDYAVWGLRIGFEETQIVTERTHEAMIPNMSRVRASNLAHPELRHYTALERFKAMPGNASAPTSGFPRAKALLDAIGEYNPDIDSKMKRELLGDPQRIAAAVPSVVSATPPPAVLESRAAKAAASLPHSADNEPQRAVWPTGTVPVEVADAVTAGDLIALDAAGSGRLGLSRETADPGVVGIVAGEPGASWKGTAPIALGGSIVNCRVDGGYGAIAAGDLLVTSATPGHAMRAGDGPREGRVVAKALESWSSGTGTIRVLVMAR
jgi:hypothetical protein